MLGHILQFKDVTRDIRVITIKPDAPYDFKAGQYTVLHTDGEDPRPFSIASAPRSDNTFDIHVRNSGQNLSHHLCNHIKQGDQTHIEPAKGMLQWQDDSAPSVFLAGGTGITPFLSLIEAMPNRPVTIYWGMENEDDFYMRPHRNGLSMHYCTENFPIDAYLKQPVEGAVIYLSGPPAMIRDSKAKLLASGVEPSNIIHDE